MRTVTVIMMSILLLFINQTFTKNKDNKEKYYDEKKYTGLFFDGMAVKSVQPTGIVKYTKVGGQINQIAVPGAVAKVIVHPHVENTFVECDAAAARMLFINDNGLLQIKPKQKKLYAQDHGIPLCTVYAALKGKLLSVSHGAHVKVMADVPLNYLEAKDESVITATINTESFSVQATGGAVVRVDGQAKYHTALVAGASVYNALFLIADSVNITTAGLAQASISAKKKLEAFATGMSSIKYAGPAIGEGARILCIFQGSCDHLGNPFA